MAPLAGGHRTGPPGTPDVEEGRWRAPSRPVDGAGEHGVTLDPSAVVPIYVMATPRATRASRNRVKASGPTSWLLTTVFRAEAVAAKSSRSE
jgi:hypothetical protein